jgi:hypothetical protein
MRRSQAFSGSFTPSARARPGFLPGPGVIEGGTRLLLAAGKDCLGGRASFCGPARGVGDPSSAGPPAPTPPAPLRPTLA